MINITTERLVLRDFLEKDAPGLFEYYSYHRVDCLYEGSIAGIDQALEDIRVHNKRSEGTDLAICIKEDDTIIGNIFSKKEVQDTYGVGWRFNKKFEDKGYATEAAKAYMEFLFRYKNARRIYAYVEESNIRSKKLCERLCIRQECCFSEFI